VSVPNLKAKEQGQRHRVGRARVGHALGAMSVKHLTAKKQLYYFSNKLLMRKSFSRKIGQKETNIKSAGRKTSAFNYQI